MSFRLVLFREQQYQQEGASTTWPDDEMGSQIGCVTSPGDCTCA